MLRLTLLASGALAPAFAAVPARAQDLHDRPVAPPPASASAPSTATEDQIQFSAGGLDYDTYADIVTATGDVRMIRAGQRLRADKVEWNRKTGKVLATGNVAVTDPQGDIAYGDSIDLTDSLKDGVVDNMLIVLERGGRIAARQGTRSEDGTLDLRDAAYTPCAVVNAAGCPKTPSWKITAVRVTYRPTRERIYFGGPTMNLFGLPPLPLPNFSAPIGGVGGNGLLSPDIRLMRVNGIQIALPYLWQFGPDRRLTITPHIFSAVAPMLQADYEALDAKGAFRLNGYVTSSRRSDDLNTQNPTDTSQALRGYIDGLARYQLSPYWSASASLRITSDRTFLRRYDISRDDRLRSTASFQRIDANSYFALDGWFVQTLRVGDSQGQQPIAIPELDYRRGIADPLLGGQVALQLNTLALTRTGGQDTQRGFASVEWDLRKLTRWGQEVTFTAFARGDVYNSINSIATAVLGYRGLDGFHARAIGALAMDVKWPLVGSFLGGTQRFTPRFQIVASPHIANLQAPNEDSRSIDLDDTNLFSLNRFPGYDRFEDSTRVTYGGEWAADLPGLSIATEIGQSYRLNDRPTILYPGTGLSDRQSDIVGRSEVRFRDLVSVIHRYRLDKAGLAVRRNELDATLGSRATYVLLGYLRLNRNIVPVTEDLLNSEEARLAGRVQIARFWSAFGSTVIDLTNRTEDPNSLSDGFDPVRTRVGFQYEDDCLRLGITWRRDYQATGDAKAGNSYLLTLAFTGLGR